MSEAAPQSVLARADRLLEAERADWQREFVHPVTALAAACTKAGAFAGSPHRERAHQLCAAELHKRTSAAVDRVLEAHGAVSAAPLGAHRGAVKDWIAARIVAEAGDLEQHLRWPWPSTPGSPYDDLRAASNVERESAYASVDNAFNRLERDRAERIRRWFTRLVRESLALLGWAHS